MSLPTDRDELLDELKGIDDSLRRLRHERGDRANEVGDQSDDASNLTGYGEEQALIENLEARRARVVAALEQLGE